MTSFTFDVETNGLLDHLTEIKCLNVINNETGEELRFTDYEFYLDAHTGERTTVRTPRDGTILDGIALLNSADEVAGHNIIGFDFAAINRVYPGKLQPKSRFDTQVVSRLFYTDVNERDAAAQRKGKYFMPSALAAKPHSLAAWGFRLGGELKAEFNPTTFGWTWNNYPFSMECDNYCMQDVRVNVEVYRRMKARQAEMEWPQESIDLEQDVQTILTRQMQHGWLYDLAAAKELTKVLQKEVIEVTEKLQDVFPPFFKQDGKSKFYAKPSRRFVVNEHGAVVRTVKGAEQRGWWSYQEGEYQPIKLTQFNPGSRDQIALMLERKYDWRPEKFTPSGKAQIDETILGETGYPEAKACAEYFLVNKKLGQVADGKKAQIKLVDTDGRMRGYVNHNGAVTGRMTHSGPNVAQTDKDARIRALYIVPKGKKLVGCDADGLELRCLAHYLAKYDKGNYANIVLKDDKASGNDMHSINQRNVGLNDRDNAKTIFYAWAYGSGDYNLGTIIYSDWDEDKQTRFNERYRGSGRNRKLSANGRKARAALVAGFTGLDKLIKQVQDKSQNPGFVRGLDGRRVSCRSKHAALNTLLQSAGALIMKKALVILDDVLRNSHGFTPGREYEFVGNIHDELQIEVDEKHAETVGKAAAQCIEMAGEFYSFRCPTTGSYDVGDNWSQTH